ncbi:rod shape-determining protein [Sphingomonas sp.]|uniref:rod shape-determining protein n=1 Tax=Sphingomonas sp. TaxID=28214 RepID=UPI003AFF674A
MAMDLGTNNIRVHARGRGVVLSEPSVIAVERRNGIRKVFAVGDEAKRALDRTPENVEVIRPLRDGVIVDLDAAVMMLGGVIRRIRPVGLVRRPLDLVICIPCGSTSVERRSLQDAARKAGASNTWLVEAPLAAAIGAGLPVNQPVGSMIVQVGGGTTEIALVALSGLAYTTSVRVGGDMMDEAIVNYVRRSHNLLIGLRSAEQLKREIGSALRPADGIGALARVKGRDLVNGVPKEIEMNQGQIAEAIAEPVGTILEGVRIALENTAPELAGDIVEQGIVLTGGGALLQGLEDLLRNETGLWVRVADDPTQCVTIGLARILDEEIWRPLLK